MQISILDPGLESLKGHHFDVDLRLCRALAGRGHEVALHGFRELQPELVETTREAGFDVTPTFRAHPYASQPDGETPEAFYRRLVGVTIDDLGTVPSADLWFWPTLTPYQLMAAIWLPAPARQVGAAWFTPRKPHAYGARCWARAARRLADTPSAFTVAVYDELVRDHYRTFSGGLEIEVAPTPHDGAPRARRSAELTRIGFFGHQRRQRGLDLLPQIVDAMLGQGFEVVLQDSGGAIERGQPHPGLTVLPFVADFAREIARCDLVVCPSPWDAYVMNPSGVASECIASGVPVVLPSGCLPADIAARFGCGIFFHDTSAPAVLEAVDDARREFARHAARAEKAALAWRAVNGSDRLAAWIEDKMAPSSATTAGQRVGRGRKRA